MIHELRIYETSPGGLGALNEGFANSTIKQFEKHGIQSFGYWTELIGTSNRLVYIVGFEDMAHRERAWNSFRQDPERQERMRGIAQQSGPPLVTRITNAILTPTAYSPKAPKGGNGWVYELRKYDALPGHLPALNERFANTTTRLFEKHGIHNIGYWTEEVGVSNRLDYMVAYESLGVRDQVWGAFGQDPEWQEATRKSREAGRPVVSQITNTILRPTDYSPLR